MKKFITLTVLALTAMFTCNTQAAVTRLVYPIFKAWTDTSHPLSGGLLYTYEVGTTTPKATYTTEEATTPLPNPVVLDSLGEQTIFLSDPTKLVLKTSDDVTLWTEESVGESTPDTLTIETVIANDVQSPVIVKRVATFAELQAITPTPTVKAVYLEERGGGVLVWDEADQSTAISKDPKSCGYIPPGSDLTGASGAWVRQLDGEGSISVQNCGGVVGADATTAFIGAAEFLLNKTNPGGTIHVDGRFEVAAGQINFWDILAAGQGITVSDGYLPNGELVRGTAINLKGDGWDASEVEVTGTGDAFVWGIFVAINEQRAMTGNVDSISFRGPGEIGHTSQVLIAGAQGFTTTTNVLAGTTDTGVTALSFETCVPGTSVTRCRFRYFQKAVDNRFGFGLNFDSTIQYCNIGVKIGSSSTTWTIGSNTEIELCAVGIWSSNSIKGYIGPCVIEANIAGCDVLLEQTRFMVIDGTWFEGSLQNVVARGSQFSPSTPNDSFAFRDVVGLNVDSNGGLINFRAVGCAMNTLGESFSVNTGEQFSNIIYERCTADRGLFDVSTITVDGIATLDDIRIIGGTISGDSADFISREPLVRRDFGSATAPSVPNKAFGLIVPNEEVTARIEIEGYWAPDSTDYKKRSFKYVGVMSRAVGAGTDIEFSAVESAATTYTTGTNVPGTIVVPTTTITGAVGEEQLVDIEFLLGTAVSGLGNTFWTCTIDQETDAINFE